MSKPPVGIELIDNQAFDDYAARHGWDYDNGGRYLGLDWDWYVSRAHLWDAQPNGVVAQSVVVMRRSPAEVCAVHFSRREPTEIWSGEIRTAADFDRLLAVIARYMADYRRDEGPMLESRL